MIYKRLYFLRKELLPKKKANCLNFKFAIRLKIYP